MIYTTQDVIAELEARISESSLRRTAKALGFGIAFLSNVRHGKQRLSPKLAAALGFQLQPDHYTKKEG